MVSAILDGRKTQTRRIAKLPKNCHWVHAADPSNDGFFQKSGHEGYWHIEEMPCPLGQEGDRLWVRETFSAMGDAERHAHPVFYRATDDDNYGRWQPSIHMPRWANRITLEITGVRVERLQDVSEEDALAEGVYGEREAAEAGLEWFDKPRRALRFLWESIYGPDSWHENPLVWVIDFKRMGNDHRNHHQM